MTNILSNSGFIEGKPRGSVVLKDLVDRINGIIQTELIDSADAIEAQSSILTATGIWLDYIGERLLYPRPGVAPEDFLWFGFDGHGLGFDQASFTPVGVDPKVPISDEIYRALLIIRGSQVITNCSIPSMDLIIQTAFGNGYYIDYGDMTLDVILDNTQSDIMIIALIDSGLLPKPAGVRIKNISIEWREGTFGFDGNGVGFDQGLFIRIYDDDVRIFT